MKPYDDKNCECYKIEKEIRTKYPTSYWSNSDACDEWQKKSAKLKNNNIKFKDIKFPGNNSFSTHPDFYACTCPTCARFICDACY